MKSNSYLKWLAETNSFWWNDSAVLQEMDDAISNGATGVTTNPLLVKRSLYAHRDFWMPYLKDMPSDLSADEKAEELIRRVTAAIADKFLPIYKATNGVQGFVCAQMNPNLQGNAEKMIEMGSRLNHWADNIALKFPCTAAGLEAIEECASAGMTTVGTASFSVPQAVAIAKRQMSGVKRAEKNGIKSGQHFSVVMVGRQDDYLRDIAHDMKLNINDEDLIQAGTAIIKRAYAIFEAEGYLSSLMPAGMRGGYHTTSLAGAKMSMSISEGIQKSLAREIAPFHENIADDVPNEVIYSLMRIPEFALAYEPDGMTEKDFITYGLTQRTMSQFVDAGWAPVREY